jgi:hypothetical protein
MHPLKTSCESGLRGRRAVEHAGWPMPPACCDLFTLPASFSVSRTDWLDVEVSDCRQSRQRHYRLSRPKNSKPSDGVEPSTPSLPPQACKARKHGVCAAGSQSEIRGMTRPGSGLASLPCPSLPALAPGAICSVRDARHAVGPRRTDSLPTYVRATRIIGGRWICHG